LLLIERTDTFALPSMLLKYPHTANTHAPNLPGRLAGNIQFYGINQELNRLGDAAAQDIFKPSSGVLTSEPWLKQRGMKLGLYNRIRCIGDKKLDL